jgi:hypothetical protein
MPLEDVDYLLDNSEQQSMLLLIDSATRDIDKYPSASSYTIDLDQPVKNVFGVEILDATVPVSQYNVNKHNNSLAFGSIYLATGFSSDDFKTYFEELQDNRVFNTNFEKLATTDMLICNSTSPGSIEFDRLIYDDTRTVPSDSSYLFIKRNVVIDTGITVFDGSLESARADSNYYSFENRGIVYRIDAASPLVTIVSSFDYTMRSDRSIVYYNIIRITQDEAVPIITSLLDPNLFLVDVYMNNRYVELQMGNFDSVTFTLFVTRVMKNVALLPSLVTTEPINITRPNDYGDFDVSSKLKFYWNGTNPFYLDMKKSTCLEGLGFPKYASANQEEYDKLVHYSNRSLFMSKFNPDKVAHELFSPNVINLNSQRYIFLRCPEIEDHVIGSYKTEKSSPGFAMMRLGGNMDMSSMRFDYVSLIRKPFHPIGKLSRLSFRFETRFGDLYEFQGIDHNFLLNIKYYVPKQKNKLEKSKLNPNYNSDFHTYTIDNMKRERISPEIKKSVVEHVLPLPKQLSLPPAIEQFSLNSAVPKLPERKRVKNVYIIALISSLGLIGLLLYLHKRNLLSSSYK